LIDDFEQCLQGHDDDLMSTLISKPAASVTTEVGQLLNCRLPQEASNCQRMLPECQYMPP